MSRTFSFISLEELTDNSSITTIDSLDNASTVTKKKRKRKACLTERGEKKRAQKEYYQKKQKNDLIRLNETVDQYKKRLEDDRLRKINNRNN